MSVSETAADGRKWSVGDEVETDEGAADRLAYRSDGKLASREAYLVVKDGTSISTSFKSGNGPCEDGDGFSAAALVKKHLEERRQCGDHLFQNMVDGRCLDMREAVNSARGLATRHCHAESAWKNRNRVRKREYHRTDMNGDEQVVVHLECGGFRPVRVKIVALPQDKLADECSSYSEYIMKCQLKNVPAKMGETEFAIYKY